MNSFYKLKNMGHKTFETLYTSNVLSTANYSAGVWGYGEFREPRSMKNRIGRFYLGTHNFTPLSAFQAELDWLDIRHSRWIELARYQNRLVNMDDRMWPKSFGNGIWTQIPRDGIEVKLIVNYAGLSCDNINEEKINLDMLEQRLKTSERNSWRLEAYNKTKLCTYVKIHDFDSIRVLVRANLSRIQRSLVTKFKCGVFPLRIETGRYKGLDKSKRFCKICNEGFIENEMHFLYGCKGLKHVIDPFMYTMSELVDGWNVLSKLYRTKLLVSGTHLKRFGSWLEDMYYTRRGILYR